MKIIQVAAQLYTVRDYLKTPQEIARSLQKIKEIGYSAIQASGLGPIDIDQLTSLIESTGLVCCATHEPPDRILNQPENVIDKLKKLKAKLTSYPYPANVPLNTVNDVKILAQKLNQIGRIFHDSGLILTYHNHHIEFRKFDNQLMLDILYQETDPKYLQAEIDTYWVQYGGGNPTDWCKKLKNRIPLLHLKDYRINKENKIDFAEIGYGNLDWKSIITAAEGSGCRWFIVEQDICPGDPFESLKKSYDYIKGNLCI